MVKKLNLIEILKDAPRGIRLWSPLFGDVIFLGICNDITYPILCLLKDSTAQYDVMFSAEGEYRYGTLARYSDFTGSKCMLFPSRENHDWSTFHVEPLQHKIFKPYQKVLVKELIGNCRKHVWIAAEYSHYDEDTKQHYCSGAYGFADDEVIPYEGNEDKLGKTVK